MNDKPVTKHSLNVLWQVDTKNVALGKLLSGFSELFKNELSTYKYDKVKLETKENVIPAFKGPPPIPFAFRDKVVPELERIVKEGVIEKVQNLQCGTSVLITTSQLTNI